MFIVIVVISFVLPKYTRLTHTYKDMKSLLIALYCRKVPIKLTTFAIYLKYKNSGGLQVQVQGVSKRWKSVRIGEP